MNADRDRGSAGVEAAIAVVGLLAVGFFIVGALRVTGAASDVDGAASAAARAAASQYEVGAAQASARSVANQVLADRGIACRDLAVDVGGDLSAGSVVVVDVICTVGLDDVLLAGFPGSRTVTGRGVELVDVIRGGR